MNRLVGGLLGGFLGLFARGTDGEELHPKRVLVVKTHAIGDLLMVTPSIVALKQLLPDSHIAVLSGSWSAEILEGNPSVDEVIVFPDELIFNHSIAGLLKLARKLAAERFDLAAIFQPSAPVQAIVALAGVPVRVGFDLDGSGFSLTMHLPWSPNSERFIGDNYMDLPRALGFEGATPDSVLVLSDVERQLAFEKFLAPETSRKNKLIAVCPGGGKNPRDDVGAKRWSADRFAQVARKLAQETGARVLVLGGKSDEVFLDAVMDRLPFKGIRPQGTSLRELACLISFCSLLITNDSAPVHIAAALKVPCVTIYGPSNPLAVGPRIPTHFVVTSPVNCSPCYSNEKFPGCKDPLCMKDIPTEVVLDSARKAISTGGGIR
ncbi:MAG: lipopolysaccharide heptosyltransferase II [Candidatus Coatesbacteria bacterium]|nr:lipopolysaccharide heptosyltransferase II [Candidatus Coatesbacteria bacterium]